MDQNLPINSTFTDQQQQIRRLQRELREAQMDRTAEAARYIKEGSQHLLQDRPHGGPWEIFRFIKEQASEFPVEKMCKVLKVTGPPGGRKGNCWDNAVAESFRFGDPIQDDEKRAGQPHSF